jgi:hypothetical protein
MIAHTAIALAKAVKAVDAIGDRLVRAVAQCDSSYFWGASQATGTLAEERSRP